MNEVYTALSAAVDGSWQLGRQHLNRLMADAWHEAEQECHTDEALYLERFRTAIMENRHYAPSGTYDGVIEAFGAVVEACLIGVRKNLTEGLDGPYLGSEEE